MPPVRCFVQSSYLRIILHVLQIRVKFFPVLFAAVGGILSSVPKSCRRWKSGCALARQRDWLLAHGADGVGLYRYGSLWANTSWPGLAAAELAALA